MSVVITGSDHIYRDLVAKINDGEIVSTEDIDWGDDEIPAGMTAEQAKVVSAFINGDFQLTVNADGTFSIKIEEGLSPFSMQVPR